MKEITVCPLCHSKDIYVFAHIPRNVISGDASKFNLDFMIIGCKICALKFLNLVPETKDELSKIYSSEYGAYNLNFNFSEKLFSKLLSLLIFKSNYQVYFNIPILKFEMQNNTVLDIGSGSGILSKFYSDEGWKVTSLDFNDNLKKLYDNNDRITFVSGDASNPNFPPNTFDLIIASQILEHLSDPIAALHNWRSTLKENGKLIIAVPNFGSATARLFNGYWFGGISAPFHLLFLNIESIERMMAETKLNILFKTDTFFPSFGQSLLQKIGLKSYDVEHSILGKLMTALFSPLDFIFNLLGKGHGLLFILEKGSD